MKPIAVSKEVFLNPIEAEQIFLAKDNQFYLGGKLMTDNELWNLSVECDQLVNMQIWSVFQETLKFQAQQLVFTGGDEGLVIAGIHIQRIGGQGHGSPAHHLDDVSGQAAQRHRLRIRFPL